LHGFKKLLTTHSGSFRFSISARRSQRENGPRRWFHSARASFPKAPAAVAVLQFQQLRNAELFSER
jgi:hypothetical protein